MGKDSGRENCSPPWPCIWAKICLLLHYVMLIASNKLFLERYLANLGNPDDTLAKTTNQTQLQTQLNTVGTSSTTKLGTFFMLEWCQIHSSRFKFCRAKRRGAKKPQTRMDHITTVLQIALARRKSLNQDAFAILCIPRTRKSQPAVQPILRKST